MTVARVSDVVAVDWLDAWCDQSETRPQDWKEECPVTTYGVLLRRTEKVVTVGCEQMPDGEYRATTHIPRGMIVRVRRLS